MLLGAHFCVIPPCLSRCRSGRMVFAECCAGCRTILCLYNHIVLLFLFFGPLVLWPLPASSLCTGTTKRGLFFWLSSSSSSSSCCCCCCRCRCCCCWWWGVALFLVVYCWFGRKGSRDRRWPIHGCTLHVLRYPCTSSTSTFIYVLDQCKYWCSTKRPPQGALGYYHWQRGTTEWYFHIYI